MPDVQIRYPSALITSTEIYTQFKNNVAEAVADVLECNSYDGTPVDLEPNHIDVHMIDYDYQGFQVRFKNAKLLVQIIGYDYPDRMRNIAERLMEIKRYIALLLGISDLDYIAITYIPIPEGCWA